MLMRIFTSKKTFHHWNAKSPSVCGSLRQNSYSMQSESFIFGFVFQSFLFCDDSTSQGWTFQATADHESGCFPARWCCSGKRSLKKPSFLFSSALFFLLSIIRYTNYGITFHFFIRGFSFQVFPPSAFNKKVIHSYPNNQRVIYTTMILHQKNIREFDKWLVLIIKEQGGKKNDNSKLTRYKRIPELIHFRQNTISCFVVSKERG